MTRAARGVVFWVLPYLLTTTACYRYAPVQTPQRGMEVRAQLTSEAAVRRSQGLDEPIMRYEGTVIEATPDSLALDVLVARLSSAVQDVMIRDTVTVRTAEIQTILERKLSVGRSAVFTVAAVAGAAALVVGVDQIVGGTGEDGDGTEPTFRPPLFSWQTLRFLLGLR